jgi:D-alanyl-D-alanine carboxypeptidase
VSSAAAPPVLHGRSASVLDMSSGAILWAENGRLRLPMASTTKLMTALVALGLTGDRTDLTMVVPPEVRQAYGELLYLRPGDQYTFLELLEGMLLPSANDAAIAIAVDSAGSLPRFVSLMNAKAQALGLADTHFANPDGLEDPDHYSSADDLAVLGMAAMEDPVIRSIVRMPSATIPWPDHGGTRVVSNINALLAYYPGATGIKTGYTSEALNVVVGSATRDGQSVVAVVMGEPPGPLWRDEENLLSYGLALAAQRNAATGASPAVAPESPGVFGTAGSTRLIPAAPVADASGAAANAGDPGATTVGVSPSPSDAIAAALLPANAAPLAMQVLPAEPLQVVAATGLHRSATLARASARSGRPIAGIGLLALVVGAGRWALRRRRSATRWRTPPPLGLSPPRRRPSRVPPLEPR